MIPTRTTLKPLRIEVMGPESINEMARRLDKNRGSVTHIETCDNPGIQTVEAYLNILGYGLEIVKIKK